MWRIIKCAIIINAILALVFFYSNYLIWNAVSVNNLEPSTVVNTIWNPLYVSVTYSFLVGGKFVSVPGIDLYLNPFVLFWIQMAINLVIIAVLKKRIAVESLQTHIS